MYVIKLFISRTSYNNNCKIQGMGNKGVDGEKSKSGRK